jgi:hypothetical protein
MASLNFKVKTFYVLLPDDGCRLPKHVAGKTVCVQVAGLLVTRNSVVCLIYEYISSVFYVKDILRQ